MAVSKEKFSDFVESLNTAVVDSRNELVKIEEENKKVLQSKEEQHLNNHHKIIENLSKRTEKHESSVLKSKTTNKTKIEKNTKAHKTRLKQIDSTKDKHLQSIKNDFKNEKSKLSEGLKTLEKNYLKSESDCQSEIDKLKKKSTAFNVESLVSRSEKKSKNDIKKIQTQLEKSLSKELNYPESILKSIKDIKQIQAQIEINKLEADTRIEKLEYRIKKEELDYQFQIGKFEQNKLREENKLTYDLDKICINYEYNIIHEALKSDQAKVGLDYKTSMIEEKFKNLNDIELITKDRFNQLEDEMIASEAIIQKDFTAKVKNNFDLSDKEHLNLFEFEKALKTAKDYNDLTQYNLSLEEIEQRTKHLISRIKTLCTQLKVDLNALSNKVKSNLKIELNMPEKQIKQINQTYKTESNHIKKQRDLNLQEINSKLALLDSSFDQAEIKKLNLDLEQIEKAYQVDANKLEVKFKEELLAYENKITYANKRADRIIEEATKLYDLQMNLYNEEINAIKETSEHDKNRAKQLWESMKHSNNDLFNAEKEIYDLSINQNKELVSYLVNYSETKLNSKKAESENKKAKNQSEYDRNVIEKNNQVKKNKANHTETLNGLESKLDAYKKGITKKIETEKNDIQRQLGKLDKQLKSDIKEMTQKYHKTQNLFNVAVNDSKADYVKNNKNLEKQQNQLISQVKSMAVNEKVELNTDDYDIYYEGSHIEEIPMTTIKDLEENNKTSIEQRNHVTEEEKLVTASKPTLEETTKPDTKEEITLFETASNPTE